MRSIMIKTNAGARKLITIRSIVKTDASILEFQYKNIIEACVRKIMQPIIEMKYLPEPVNTDLNKFA